MQEIEIDGRRIGPDNPPYVIAEVSANHGGDLTRAKRIIRLASEAGADAVKFQLYTPDSLTLDVDRPEFRITESGLWHGERLYDLYARAQTPAEWFPELFSLSRDLGLTPFASVFDAPGMELLQDLGAPMLKVASFEAVDLELITDCAHSGLPLLLSTGLCTLNEIDEAVETFRASGGRHLILLHCNSAYPAEPAEADLLTIPELIRRFDAPVGYSDHTLDATQAVAAVALGACVVEKHFIDNREPATPDSAFSSLPSDFRSLAVACRAAYQARGSVRDGPTERERGSLVFRRSLFVARPVRVGDLFTHENIRSVRPGVGLAPKHLPEILGRTAARDLEPGTPLTWEVVQ